MLQQILKEMYIDPDVLEALNEEQKKILFLKMRQEQVRRWTEREENFEKESECLNSAKPKQASPKSVSWLLGNDGDVHVCVIGEAAEAKPYNLIHSQVDDKREMSNHNARAPVSETFQKTERQISTPQEDGIQLNFQTAEKEEDTADPITELKDSGLYYRPHLQHKEPQFLALRLSARDRQEEKEGRDFKIVPAARRPMLSSDSEEANQSPDNPTAQGRVAELRKNFNHLQVTSGKNTLSRVKPPLPAKPTTFQLMSSAGFRSPPQGSTKYILSTKEQAQLSGSVSKLNQLSTAAVTVETREAETEYYIVSPEHKRQHKSDLKQAIPHTAQENEGSVGVLQSHYQASFLL